jgi:D-sedoheptulose 7-phosphate isomerase
VAKIRQYLDDIQRTIDRLPVDQINKVIGILRQARVDRKQIFLMGNGGSASTATHFVCDLMKNTRNSSQPPFKVFGLVDNIASITAFGNDEGFDQVFAQQLYCLVQPGDIVIAISTSGNSPNILRAVEVAKHACATSIGFTGFDGGALGLLVDLHICVPNDCVPQIEDIHLMLEHMICKIIREDDSLDFVQENFSGSEPVVRTSFLR